MRFCTRKEKLTGKHIYRKTRNANANCIKKRSALKRKLKSVEKMWKTLKDTIANNNKNKITSIKYY